MTKIKVNWEIEKSGSEILDLEDYDITLEEWEDYSEDERKDILQEFLWTEDDTVGYGLLTTYRLED